MFRTLSSYLSHMADLRHDRRIPDETRRFIAQVAAAERQMASDVGPVETARPMPRLARLAGGQAAGAQRGHPAGAERCRAGGRSGAGSGGMTTFDRDAYMKRISELTLASLKAAREVGANIGSHGSAEEFFALTRKADAAHRELLHAIYELPHELDGVKIRERAA